MANPFSIKKFFVFCINNFPLHTINNEGGKSWRNRIRRKALSVKRLRKTNKLRTANSNFESSCFDPLGSYTGVSKDKYEKPVQDADDLWYIVL